MPAKGVSVSLEKKIQKTAAGLEDLFKSLGEFVSSALEDATGVAVKAASKKVSGVSKKTLKTKLFTKTPKVKSSKSASKRGRKAGGGLKESLLEICKSSSGPLTEAEIAKKLLEDPDKYKWNKNESTLYQTLRRAVKENLISDSGRDKSTKTYQVA